MSLKTGINSAATAAQQAEAPAKDTVLDELKTKYKGKQAFLAKRLHQFHTRDASIVKPNADAVYVPESEEQFEMLKHYAKQPMDYVIPLF